MSKSDKEVIEAGLLGNVLPEKTRSGMNPPDPPDVEENPTARTFLEIDEEGRQVKVTVPPEGLLAFLSARVKKAKEMSFETKAQRQCFLSQKATNDCLFSHAFSRYANTPKSATLEPIVRAMDVEQERFYRALEEYGPQDPESKQLHQVPQDTPTGNRNPEVVYNPPSGPNPPPSEVDKSSGGNGSRSLIESLQRELEGLKLSNQASYLEAKKYRDALDVVRVQMGEQPSIDCRNIFFQAVNSNPEKVLAPVLTDTGVALVPAMNQPVEEERPGRFPDPPRFPTIPESKIEFYINGLYGGKESLKTLTSTKITSKTATPVIRDLYATQRQVTDAIDRLEKTLKAYISDVPEIRQSEEQIFQAQSEISSAHAWLNSLRQAYQDSGLMGISHDKDILITPTKFQDDPSIHIYEFLRLFETRYSGRGSTEQMAAKLFRDHLSKDHQPLFTGINDYEQLKTALQTAFGQPAKVLNSVMKIVEDTKKPTTKKEELHRLICLKKVMNQLLKLKDIDFNKIFEGEVSTASLFTHDTITRLQSFIPDDTKEEYAKTLVKEKMYADGLKAFEKLLEVVTEAAHVLNALLDMNPETKPTGKTHRVSAAAERDESSDGYSTDSSIVDGMYEGEDGYVCMTGDKRNWNNSGNNNYREKKNWNKPANENYRDKKPKYEPTTPPPDRRKSPTCPLQGKSHYHPAASCPEFFQNRGPALRTILAQERCVVCLGPADMCKLKCHFQEHLSPKFFCQQCKVKFPVPRPCTILCCSRAEHWNGEELEDFMKDLELLLPGIRREVLAKPVRNKPVFTVNRDAE